MGRLASRILDHFEENFCGIMLLAVTAILFLNVVLRYVFRMGFAWSDEFVRYGMIWIAFIGISMATRKGHRLAVDIILHYTSAAATRAINVVVDVVSAAFALAVFYYGVITVETMMQTAQVSPGMGLPMYIPYLVLPVSGALLTLRFLQSAWYHLKNPPSPEKDAPEGSGD